MLVLKYHVEVDFRLWISHLKKIEDEKTKWFLCYFLSWKGKSILWMPLLLKLFIVIIVIGWELSVKLMALLSPFTSAERLYTFVSNWLIFRHLGDCHSNAGPAKSGCPWITAAKNSINKRCPNVRESWTAGQVETGCGVWFWVVRV